MQRSILTKVTPTPITSFARMRSLLESGVKFLPYLVAGKVAGCPGTYFRASCAGIARSILHSGDLSSWKQAFHLVTGPMDSVRYFEFDFAHRASANPGTKTYLDVSSPRLFPLVFLRQHKQVTATLLNPDRDDLAQTRQMITRLGLTHRCTSESRVIGECDFDNCFDVITSISVVEHIPEDTEAIRVMWRALRPGGRLILTVPCASTPYEEMSETNQYNVLSPDDDGLIFWQRFYSQSCLEHRIFSITGKPSLMEVFGEVRRGVYDENTDAKRRNLLYPIWREPWYMAREWKYFPDVHSLPGVGVIGMMFKKGN